MVQNRHPMGSASRMAKLRAVSSHLPEMTLTNHELARLFPSWPADKIEAKTGIVERRIAAPHETAADLATLAAQRLFNQHEIDPEQIDFLLFCTQTPDRRIPTGACSLHLRLGLRPECGALDISLACSGFVYGLALAKGLIESGLANTVLLLTADTYSKLIHPLDRSVRTLFGDAAAATLIEGVDAEQSSIGPFVFGTDGRGADRLCVPAGGARLPVSPSTADAMTDGAGNVRSAENLFMDGAAIMAFSLTEIPKAVARLAELSGIGLDEMDAFIFHQANAFLLEALRRKTDLPRSKFIVCMSHHGNTVSSSIPLALEGYLRERTSPASVMLVGFGAGLSWAATNVVLN